MVRVKNTFEHQPSDIAKCVFWNSDANNWLDDGCTQVFVDSTSTETVCECTHITTANIALVDLTIRLYINTLTDLKHSASAPSLSFPEWQSLLDNLTSVVNGTIAIKKRLNLRTTILATNVTLDVMNDLIKHDIWLVMNSTQKQHSYPVIFDLLQELSRLVNYMIDDMPNYQQQLRHSNVSLFSQVYTVNSSESINFNLNTERILLQFDLPFSGLEYKEGEKVAISVAFIDAPFAKYLAYQNFTSHTAPFAVAINDKIGVQLKSPYRFFYK